MAPPLARPSTLANVTVPLDMPGFRSRRRARILAATLVLGVVLGGTLGLLLAVSPSAAAETWVESGAVDFGQGTRQNLVIGTTGDLVLVTGLQPTNRRIVLNVGALGSSDGYGAFYPMVLRDGGTYRMWYAGSDGSRVRLLYATSSDGVSWTKRGVAIEILQAPYYFDGTTGGFVTKEGSSYYLWFTASFWGPGELGYLTKIYYAASSDAMNWSIVGPVLDVGGPGSWDDAWVGYPRVVKDAAGLYRMYYTASDGSNIRAGVALASDHTNFSRWSGNPVLDNGPPGSWNAGIVGITNVREGAPWAMYYTGTAGIGAPGYIGNATSSDGYDWTTNPANPWMSRGSAGAWDSASIGSPFVVPGPEGLRLYYDGSDGTLRVGMAVLANATSGFYESRVFDSGGDGTTWRSIAWNGSVPRDTTLNVSFRSGGSSWPDSTWSLWSAVSGPSSGSRLSDPRNRFAQYRVDFATSNVFVVPSLHSVAVMYSPNRAPSTELVGPASGVWLNDSRPTLAWNATDADGDEVSTFEVELSRDPTFTFGVITSGLLPPTSASWQPMVPLETGPWYWRVRAQDAYGLWGTWSVDAFGIDPDPPALMVFAPSSGAFLGTRDLHVVWIAADSASGLDHVDLRLDADSAVRVSPALLDYTYVNVPDGNHMLEVVAIGRAGNRNEAILVVRVDATPPSLTVTTPAPGSILHSSVVEVSWTSQDLGAGVDHYELQLDNDTLLTLGSTSTSHAFAAVADGRHEIRLTAVDRAGNRFLQTTEFQIDTNVLSLSGPYGPGPILAIMLGAVAAAGAAVYLRRRRRGRGGAPVEPLKPA